MREEFRKGKDFWPELVEAWACFLEGCGEWLEMQVSAFQVELMGRQLDILIWGSEWRSLTWLEV